MDAIRRPRHCRKTPGCLDYRKFAFELEGRLEAGNYPALNRALAGLGRVQSEHLGIRRIGGDWGFLITPPPGFPELSVSFFRNVDEPRMSDMLERIATLIEAHAGESIAQGAARGTPAARHRETGDAPRQ